VTLAAADRAGLLELGELEVLGLLPRSSNATFLARVRRDERDALVVYKPRVGESPLWDFPDGTLGAREVAAYYVAEALGWPTIPPTILRDGPHGPGMVQLFLEFDPAQHYFTMRDERPDDFRRVALFDAIVNNADRKGGHCLLARTGELFCVDHGVCFHAEPKLRTVIWDFAGEPVEPELRAEMDALSRALASGPLRGELEPLLSEEELAALERRTELLVATGRFPEPGSGRAFPWPPV
jgi:hypothetical protein